MSSKKDSTASSGDGSATKYEARLCHVVKRPDFDGYGFNLHAEKGRPGQYIGKVDDGSPAEAAGLRQGDRIIDVNGTNITTETHKKVVELIKGIPNETKLLVIDPRADADDLKAAIAKSKIDSNGVDVNDNSKQVATAGTESGEHMMTNGTKDSSNKNKHDVNGTNGSNNNTSNEDVNNKKKSSSSNSSVDTSANKSMMMTNGDASTTAAKKQPVDQIIEDTKALSVASNGSSTTKPAMNGSSNGSAAANGSASKEGPKLNLNMTAAELRAQLAARKKYDPKNDVCDLRKKYEIIQKM